MPAEGQSNTDKAPIESSWQEAVRAFTKPDHRKAVWQLVNTFVPYLALWAAMIATRLLGLSYWLTLALALPASFLAVRIFIFFHDACHGSFLSSTRANAVIGYICGTLTFTPFHEWQASHAYHHATAGNLDKRGVGDVWTMTVQEYLAAKWPTRLAYRAMRNPFVLFVLGPVVKFVFVQRVPQKGGKPREVRSVWITNALLAAIILTASFTIGFWNYVLIQLPIMWLAGTIGIWLFYVQHQYEDVYWARNAEWDVVRAAMEGSSYYKLPQPLRWLTGNIGLHHIHHLRPRVANYHLQACQDTIRFFQQARPLTFLESLKSLDLNLWDEELEKMVPFRALGLARGTP
jgi:omega-6 fatty acid desaturase (delta-12 desaturase)